MDNLNSALKRIKKKKEMKEAAALVTGAAKAVAVGAKAAAKAAAAGGKAAAKGSKAAAKAAKTGAKAAKTGAKAAGDAAKGATKPVSKNLKFKRPNVRNAKYKDAKTGQFNKDLYDKDRATYQKIKQDQANRPDMSQTKPDGPSDDRTKRGERKLKAIDKITDKKKEGIKKGLQTTGDVAKKTAQVAGDAANYARKKTKSAVSATSGAFGTSSFSKESKITFQQFIDKIP